MRMKEISKKLKRAAVYLLISAITCTGIVNIPSVEVQAAARADNAKKAYSNFLSKPVKWSDSYKNPSELEFGLMDFNNDGISELYIHTKKWDNDYDYKLYSYVDNKVKCIHYIYRGGKLQKVYPSRGVFVTTRDAYRGVSIRQYWKYTGRKVLLKADTFYSAMNDTTYYSDGCDEISKSKFNKTVNGLIGSAASKSAPRLYDDTASNRKKLLSVNETNPATGASLNKKTVSLKVGKSVVLKLNNASGKVSWKSSNKSVVSVSADGVVKGMGIGTAKITAVCGGKSYVCKVTVNSLFNRTTLWGFTNGGFYLKVKSISGNKMVFSVYMPEMTQNNIKATIQANGRNAKANFMCSDGEIHYLTLTKISGGIRVTEKSACSTKLVSMSAPNYNSIITHDFLKEYYSDM